VLAARPDAVPADFDAALAQAAIARELWQRAAITREDWPEARRNVERALLWIEELSAQRDVARANTRKKLPQPRRPEDLSSQEAPPTPPAELEKLELTPEQLQELLEQLARKDLEKRERRREQAAEEKAHVERDW
jgi:hypothetical protein